MRYKNKDLARLLANSLYLMEKKKVAAIIDSFLIFLKKINSFSRLPAIIRDFEDEWDKKNKIQKVSVSSASRLAESVRDGLLSVLPAGAELKEIIEPDLLGGIKIRIGDLLLDATLKNRLMNLKKTIRA